MSLWNSRNYHFYLIFADVIQGKEPWRDSVWTQRLAPILQGLLQQSPHFAKTGMGCLQYAQRTDSQYYAPIKFGQLGWNSQSFAKWCWQAQAEPQTQDEPRKFGQLDIWTPKRTVCATLDTPPDIYFSLSNEANTELKAAQENRLQFGSMFVLAVAEDMAINPLPSVQALIEATHAKKALYRSRPWRGLREKNPQTAWQFINDIQDTISASMYRPADGSIHNIAINDWQCSPYWQVIAG